MKTILPALVALSSSPEPLAPSTPRPFSSKSIAITTNADCGSGMDAAKEVSTHRRISWHPGAEPVRLGQSVCNLRLVDAMQSATPKGLCSPQQ